MKEDDWLNEQLKDIPSYKRINITPVELKYEKPVSCKEFYLEFHEDHLVYKFDFQAEVTNVEEDVESGWREERIFTDAVVKKVSSSMY